MTFFTYGLFMYIECCVEINQLYTYSSLTNQWQHRVLNNHVNWLKFRRLRQFVWLILECATECLYLLTTSWCIYCGILTYKLPTLTFRAGQRLVFVYSSLCLWQDHKRL